MQSLSCHANRRIWTHTVDHRRGAFAPRQALRPGTPLALTQRMRIAAASPIMRSEPEQGEVVLLTDAVVGPRRAMT
jgi:hypothetical protein